MQELSGSQTLVDAWVIGPAQTLADGWFVCSCFDGDDVVADQRFGVCGGELAECALPAAVLEGRLNPCNDCAAELVTVVPYWRLSTFFWSCEKNNSIAALSSADATRPIGP